MPIRWSRKRQANRVRLYCRLNVRSSSFNVSPVFVRANGGGFATPEKAAQGWGFVVLVVLVMEADIHER